MVPARQGVSVLGPTCCLNGICSFWVVRNQYSANNTFQIFDLTVKRLLGEYRRKRAMGRYEVLE